MKRSVLRLSLLLAPLLIGAVVAAIVLGGLGGFGHRAAAAGTYQLGLTGHDISYPQCSSPGSWPSGDFGIVGVTGGRAFTVNSCLASEYAWAQTGVKAAPSLYLNLNAPVGSTASEGQSGPAGVCAKSNKACYAYNYGYNAAAYAFGRGASATMWWLDIETGNSWSQQQALNDDTIEGAVDYIEQQSATAGIYSTKSMWTTIAGSAFQPGTIPIPGGAQKGTLAVANWIPGGTSSSCTGITPLYSTGQVWLAQFSASPYDADYSC
jgi:hypothetical protein